MTKTPQDFLQRAIADGLLLITSGKTERIRYVAANFSERWSDPEEKVRAAYYAETLWREARERFEQQLLKGGN
ncbi:MAG: hypothetical protein ACOX9C_01915 [Kiritimatiellia bacterium]|jgi:type I restriction enzyme M protein